MNEITVSAKTVSDAITEASIQLGVSSDKIAYEVTEKGSAGFLGFGTKKAVIKAHIMDSDEKSLKEQLEQLQLEETKPTEAKSVESKPAESKSVEKKSTESRSAEKKPTELAVVTQEAIDETEKFLTDVIKAMGIEVKLTSTIDSEGALAIDLKGENMGILIGKRGQTLDSIQYLANRVANRVQDGYVRVKLDTENYRDRRKTTLENLAKNIAYKVARTKQAVSLEPMNPYERRIIHSVLQSDPYVSTHSEGDEPYRRVVITLSKKN